MPEEFVVSVNGVCVEVPQGATALAAILSSGNVVVRRSVSGMPRGPLCGMGICFECRATINRRRHCRTCQILCEPEMDIVTGD